MPVAPDRSALLRGLDSVARRLAAKAFLRGVAGGALVALALLLAAALIRSGVAVLPSALGWGLALALPAAGGLVAFARERRRSRTGSGGPRAAAAVQVEAHAPASRNLVRTAEEISRPRADDRADDRPDAAIRAAVTADAAALVAALDAAAVVPLRRPALAAIAAVAAATVLAGAGLPRGLLPSARPAADPATQLALTPEGATATVRVHLHPPAWIGGTARTLDDPGRIEVVEGSRIELEVQVAPAGGPVSGVRAETLEGVRELDSRGEGRFTTSLVASAAGFLAIEGVDAAGSPHFHHLVGLQVVPDAPPTLEIRLPGHDLHLPDGDREIEVVVEARDDHALAELELVYTRVSGFGELFEFLEGTIPLAIERETADRWRGRAHWSLTPLALERGEFAVYHARARDRRPGAPWATSDRWVVEVLGGEAQAAGGFAGEDELTRYAMSQQMVLILMERLAAGRDTLSDEGFLEESRILAAGQRRVRTEFVFMLGGELEDESHLGAADAGAAEPEPGDPDAGFTPVDPAAPADLHEEAHARADQDAAEGRLAQQGRMELSRAVQAMAITATHLQAGQLPPAQEAGEVALEHLQSAFSSSRYILRALPEREELDMDRRLTGSTDDATPDRRTTPPPTPDPETATLRGVLAELATLASRPDPALLAATASTLLGVAPADPDFQAMVTALRGAALQHEQDPARAAEEVAGVRRALVALLRARLAEAPAAGPGREVGLLEGLLHGAGGAP